MVAESVDLEDIINVATLDSTRINLGHIFRTGIVSAVMDLARTVFALDLTQWPHPSQWVGSLLPVDSISVPYPMPAYLDTFL